MTEKSHIMQCIVGIRLKKSGKIVVCRTNNDRNSNSRDSGEWLQTKKKLNYRTNKQKGIICDSSSKFLVVCYSIGVLGIIIVVVANKM